MAMEYLPLGGLQQYIPSAIGEDSVKEIAMQVLKGLKYMHEAGYTHRDIKPAVSLPPFLETSNFLFSSVDLNNQIS